MFIVLHRRHSQVRRQYLRLIMGGTIDGVGLSHVQSTDGGDTTSDQVFIRNSGK